MLAAALGPGNKTLYRAAAGDASRLYLLPFRREDDGRRRLLVVSKLAVAQQVQMPLGGWCDEGEGLAIGVEPGAPEPGFVPPQRVNVTAGRLALGGYALATIDCGA